MDPGFANLLTQYSLFVTLKSVLGVLLWSFVDPRVVKNLSHSMRHLPAEAKQGSALLSCFSSHCKRVPFCILFSAMFFSHFCVSCWGFCYVICKVASKLGTEVLSNVLKLKQTEMCLREEIRVLDKLCLGPS